MKNKDKEFSLINLMESGKETIEREYSFTPEEKQAFLNDVRQLGRYKESIYRSQDLKQAVEEICRMAEMANTFTLKETDGWFDKVTANRHMKQMKEAAKVLKKEAAELMEKQQRVEAAYEDIGRLMNVYYNVDGDE